MRQAQKLGERLQGEEIKFLYCSPFLRTAQTAHQVATVLDLPVRVEPGLGECLLKRLYDKMPKLRSPQELKEWHDMPLIDATYTSKWALKYPESYKEVFERCKLVFREMAERHKQGDVLLVAHGLPLEYMAKAAAPHAFKQGNMTYCCLTECIQSEGQWSFGAFMEDGFLEERQDMTDAKAQEALWKSS
ncbi:unnamed protein product [Ostreobium quekettii]|uniref:Phosphoglycerate mutase n=1 Tax=Ostreobium quekettii TaxID=121088 RepID=A0A8S1JDN0_9CHLO|nr:unnamed protein product [Ostreobium quekettii]